MNQLGKYWYCDKFVKGINVLIANLNNKDFNHTFCNAVGKIWREYLETSYFLEMSTSYC